MLGTPVCLLIPLIPWQPAHMVSATCLPSATSWAVAYTTLKSALLAAPKLMVWATPAVASMPPARLTPNIVRKTLRALRLIEVPSTNHPSMQYISIACQRRCIDKICDQVQRHARDILVSTYSNILSRSRDMRRFQETILRRAIISDPHRAARREPPALPPPCGCAHATSPEYS